MRDLEERCVEQVEERTFSIGISRPITGPELIPRRLFRSIPAHNAHAISYNNNIAYAVVRSSFAVPRITHLCGDTYNK